MRVKIRYLLNKFKIDYKEPVVVPYANKTTIDITNNLFSCEITKYVEIDFLFGAKKVQDESITTKNVSSKFEVADIFTKLLENRLLLMHIVEMGVENMKSSC